MPANGSAEWKGDVPTGAGTFTAGDTISGGYTFKSRFEDGPGSNPEQLIGAAHAACFSMALSAALTGAGNPPKSISTKAAVHLDKLDSGFAITKNRTGNDRRSPRHRRRHFPENRRRSQSRLPHLEGPGLRGDPPDRDSQIANRDRYRTAGSQLPE